MVVRASSVLRLRVSVDGSPRYRKLTPRRPHPPWSRRVAHQRSGHHFPDRASRGPAALPAQCSNMQQLGRDGLLWARGAAHGDHVAASRDIEMHYRPLRSRCLSSAAGDARAGGCRGCARARAPGACAPDSATRRETSECGKGSVEFAWPHHGRAVLKGFLTGSAAPVRALAFRLPRGRPQAVAFARRMRDAAGKGNLL